MSLIHYYKTECKLLLRGPGFYLMSAIIAGLLYLGIQTADANLDRGAFVAAFFRIYGMVAILILPLQSTAIARRDAEWKTTSMMASFPYRIWQMETARLLGALTLPIIAALVPMGVYACLVINDGNTWGMREWYTCGVWASFTIPMIFATVLAYLTGTLIRKRTSYLISFALLASLTIVLPEFLKSGRPPFTLPPHKQMWFDYAMIRAMDKSYSRMWGFIHDPVFWLHRGMVAVLAAGLALLVLFVIHRRRQEPVKAKLVFPAILLLGVALIGAGCAMRGTLQERVAIAAANERFYSERLASDNNPSQQRELEKLLIAGMAAGNYTEADIGEMSRMTFTDKYGSSKPLTISHIKDLLAGVNYQKLSINSYKLDLTIRPKHGLNIKARMQASNGQKKQLQRFPIMLRHLFDVTEVKVNGAPAAYDWEVAADVLWITPVDGILPGEHLEIEMAYGGNVNDWRHYPSSWDPSRDTWEQITFIENDRLFLPAFYGWYPVIGNDRLSEWLTPHYAGDLEFPAPKAIMDTHHPRPLADFDVAITGPTGLKLFSNASVVTDEQGGEKEAAGTHLRLNQASGLTLFGGDLQLAEATVEGKTLRLLASGQYSTRSIKEAAQLAAHHYAEAARTIKMMDGEAATSFPQTVTMALADYPYTNMVNWASDNIDMVDATDGGPETRDVHFLSMQRLFGTEIKQGNNGNIELRTGQHWLDYSAKRREIRNGRVENLNAQYCLNNLFQAYIERKVAAGRQTEPLFEPVSDYFLSGTSSQVYDLTNTLYNKYGIEGVYDVIKLVYESIGSKLLDQDSNEQIEELLRGYLNAKTEG